jgi:zinc finger-like protein
MMPLKLIERVLPWFVGSLAEVEAEIFLKNIQLAGSISSLICFSLKELYL